MLFFFLCPVTDISATVALVGVKFCMVVHIGPGQVSPFGAILPCLGSPPIRSFGFKFWRLDREYLENGKSQRYMSNSTSFLTSSSAVAERPRDDLCPSVVSLSKIIARANSFIIVT